MGLRFELGLGITRVKSVLSFLRGRSLLRRKSRPMSKSLEIPLIVCLLSDVASWRVCMQTSLVSLYGFDADS